MANQFSYTEIASATAQLIRGNIPAIYEYYHLRSSVDEKHLVELSSSIQRAVSQTAVVNSFGKTINTKGLTEYQLQNSCLDQTEKVMSFWSKRISTRSYSSDPIEIEKVALLLKSLVGMNPTLQHRSYASAGACFPNEIFINVRNVKGIDPGFYFADLESISLRLVRKGEFRLTLEDHEPDTALSVVIIALFDKVTYKYGERGYRFALLEAGAMTQIIETTANYIGLGAVSSGGFRDDMILSVADLALPQAGVMAVVHVGKKGEK